MKAQIKRAMLLALAACDGVPMPEASLLAAAGIMTKHLAPTQGDLVDGLKDCEAEGYASGLTDDFTKDRNWTLTAKGTHKARELK